MRNVYGTYQNVNRVSETFFVKVSRADPYIVGLIYGRWAVDCRTLYIYIWVRAGNLNKKCITRSVHVLIRSVYVPHTFPLHFERIYYKMIRSYTFRATLPFKCGNVPPEAYVPTRSVQPCREKRKT